MAHATGTGHVGTPKPVAQPLDYCRRACGNHLRLLARLYATSSTACAATDDHAPVAAVITHLAGRFSETTTSLLTYSACHALHHTPRQGSNSFILQPRRAWSESRGWHVHICHARRAFRNDKRQQRPRCFRIYWSSRAAAMRRHTR